MTCLSVLILLAGVALEVSARSLRVSKHVGGPKDPDIHFGFGLHRDRCTAIGAGVLSPPSLAQSAFCAARNCIHSLFYCLSSVARIISSCLPFFTHTNSPSLATFITTSLVVG